MRVAISVVLLLGVIARTTLEAYVLITDNVQSKSLHPSLDDRVLIAKRSSGTTLLNNDTHSNDTHSNGTEERGNSSQGDDADHGSHGIHVVSWNFEYVKSPFIISVFLLAAGIAKLGFHHADVLSSRVPESCLLIILGTVVGAILHATLPEVFSNLGMSSELFFLFLLPPIIIEAAYSLHDRAFYENVGTVVIYAVIGTILNCFLIGPSLYGIYRVGGMGPGMADVTLIQCLVFSSIIVAVDPVAVLAIFQEIGVNNTLYFLVFGESLLNDAVTVVLYNTMKTLNTMEHITADQIALGVVQFFVVSIGGLTMGIVFGFLTAIITKYSENCRVVEPLAVIVLAYTSYLCAEMFHFSGIISIIGCGLTQAQYAFHNISRKSNTTVKYFSKMLSATCDCIIFMFLGLGLFKRDVLDRGNWHAGFILWTLLLCLLYRFIVVFGLTLFLNKSSRLRKVDTEEQFMMAYGGLRGAVAFSLVDVLDQSRLPKGIFLTTTVMVIFFTVFVQGISIKPLVKFLRVRMEFKAEKLISEEINSHVTDHVMAGIEEILGEKGENYIRELFDHYNTRYLKLWLQRDPITADEQIMLHFEKLALQQHFENLAGSKMIMEKYCSETALDELLEEEEPEEDAMSDLGSEGGGFTLSIPSLNVSSENVSADLDLELIRENVDKRRKSLFPVALSRDQELRLAENPTADDVKKIMVPSRRQMQFKRLDKNLKSADSENDLLRYLQNKQMKTRRMSRAVLGIPTTVFESPEHQTPSPRRRSVAPAAMTQNYKRRLSLAVPEASDQACRRRLVSAGNVLKGVDSPARRRLRFQRSRTFGSDTDDKETGSPRQPTRGLPKALTSLTPPSSPRRRKDTPMALGIISEHSEESAMTTDAHSGANNVQAPRRKTGLGLTPVTEAEPSPQAERSPAAISQSSDTEEFQFPERGSRKGMRRTGSSSSGSPGRKSPPFYRIKSSPVLERKKRLKKSKSESRDEPGSEEEARPNPQDESKTQHAASAQEDAMTHF